MKQVMHTVGRNHLENGSELLFSDGISDMSVDIRLLPNSDGH